MLVFILGVDECLFGGRFLGGVVCSNGVKFVSCLGDTSYSTLFKIHITIWNILHT